MLNEVREIDVKPCLREHIVIMCAFLTPRFSNMVTEWGKPIFFVSFQYPPLFFCVVPGVTFFCFVHAVLPHDTIDRIDAQALQW